MNLLEPPRVRRTGGLLGLTALFAAALALRPQVVGVGPLLPAIQADLSMSHGTGGLVSTIPVLFMGIFSPLAPVVTQRVGTRAAIAGCLALTAACGVLRAASSSALTLLSWTLVIGVAIGVAGAILPIAVKEQYPDRPATATGIYAAGIQVGAAAAAGAAVPIAAQWNTWRAALVAFSVAAALTAVAWWVTEPAQETARRAQRVRLPWRAPVAWLLTAVFALQSIPYYGINAWLPAWLQEVGWEPSDAGNALAVFNVAALVATLTVPRMADWAGTRRTYLVASASAATVALAVMLLEPAGALVCVSVLGVALGALFALSLTLPLDVSHTPEEVGAMAGLMLGVGYALAALTPFVLGALRDVSGSFSGGLWLLVGLGVVTIGIALPLSPHRLQRDR